VLITYKKSRDRLVSTLARNHSFRGLTDKANRVSLLTQNVYAGGHARVLTLPIYRMLGGVSGNGFSKICSKFFERLGFVVVCSPI